jgi:hypothetical protein
MSRPKRVQHFLCSDVLNEVGHCFVKSKAVALMIAHDENILNWWAAMEEQKHASFTFEPQPFVEYSMSRPGV